MTPYEIIESLFDSDTGRRIGPEGSGLNDPSFNKEKPKPNPQDAPHISVLNGEPQQHAGFKAAVNRIYGKEGHVEDSSGKVVYRGPYNEPKKTESVVESILQEALSPELASALKAAGHQSHISTSVGQKDGSTAIIHNNTRYGTSERMGEHEGPYRITFLDKESSFSPSGVPVYANEISPAAHISYDKVEDAVRHFGDVKKLHGTGAPNEHITAYLAAGNHGAFNYSPRTPRTKARELAMLADEAPDTATPTLQKMAAIEMRRDLNKNKQKQLPFEQYEFFVKDVANSLTEDILDHEIMRPDIADSAKQIGMPRSYRRKAQIAAAMGAATMATV